MGLAGVKNKVKIGADPRNTAWSNDTSRFGHKHLEKLGWAPGLGLGTGSSGESPMTSHVKVTVKTDNTGLGRKSSKKGSQGLDGEITTGLDVFQRLLGRLNGKSQDSIDNQIRDQRQRLVTENSRFGMIFEYGGLLEGSIERSNKRKRGEEDEEDDDKEDEEDKPVKSVKDKKSKKQKKEAKEDKADKKARRAKEKEEKKEKKDKKDKKDKKEKSDKKGKKEKKEKEKGEKSSKKTESTAESRESSAEPWVPTLRGRQATRARFIAQKRAATADAKGLSEILMIRA